jgi:ribosomal protein L32E
VKHQWGVWEYEAPNSCSTVRFCRRCTASERSDEEMHQWSEWRRRKGMEKRYCRHCGETQEIPDIGAIVEKVIHD